MRQGDSLLVSSGIGSYKAYFLQWLDETHCAIVTKYGKTQSIAFSSVTAINGVEC